MNEGQNGVAPNGISLNAGMRLPFLKKGGTFPSFLSQRFGNQIIAATNAWLNAKIKVRKVTANQDGSIPQSTVVIANDNVILDIAVPSGGTNGSGVANVVLCQVTAESDEYVTCQPLLATGDGTYVSDGDPFNVAKPQELRVSPGEGFIINPAYYPDGFVYAAQSPTGGTGVFLAGEDVGYIDLNAAARRWTAGNVVIVTLTKVFKDYIVCEDGDSNEYRIAKTYKNRNSLASEVIYGTTVDYTYPHNSSSADSLYGRYRVATIDGNSENQGYVPQYIIGDEIDFFAAPTPVTTEADDTVDEGTPVNLKEATPRIWSQFNDQTFGT